jgi:serine/threonine-protein kinase
MAVDDEDTRNLHGLATVIDADPELLVDVEDVPLVEDTDRYQTLGVLAKGGMGEIQLCKDERIARQVAMKVLRGNLRDKEEYRSRFLFEARLQGQLEHPAIVPVHDLGATPNGGLFFTMKRIRGVTLRDALKAVEAGDPSPRFSRRRLVSALSSVCLAVDFAHTRGVVHRDLKPENVMLGDFGEIYILDWGIAKVMHRPDTAPGEVSELHTGDETPTRAGTVLGTPRYMAPERSVGIADPRTDIFALGIMLAEILAAHPRAVPPELAAIAAHAHEKVPAWRYATARELHEAIEEHLDGDRDLEARKKLAEDHARRAEIEFDRSRLGAPVEVRARAAHDLGRALGMDPQNPRALHTLMRMLTEVPAALPPEAQAEMDRRWNERRTRTVRSGIVSTGALLLLVPFILAMGVTSWGALLAFIALCLGASTCQWLAVRGQPISPFSLPVAGAYLCTMGALAVLSTSMGVLGVLPATLAIVTMAYRINVVRWTHGLAILLVALAALFAPFFLEWIGAVSPTHVFAGGALLIRPEMHAFPQTATQVYLVFSCAGAVTIALLYGRLYVNELRRAERELTFYAWQLQQLLPPGD